MDGILTPEERKLGISLEHWQRAIREKILNDSSINEDGLTEFAGVMAGLWGYFPTVVELRTEMRKVRQLQVSDLDTVLRRSRLDEAREERQRWQKVDSVFREVLSRARLSHEEMLEMMKKLPGISKEHLEYMEGAPSPDDESFFGDTLMLCIK